MSSSSSLSAARRRRAGGQQPASNSRPELPTPQQSSPRPSGSGPAPNPYMLLQQHHVKINELEKKINEINSGKNTDNTHPTETIDTSNSHVDPTNFSDMIINRIESQLDLKAFYDNDTRLANDMEELNKIVQSQQLVINEMNTTLFHVIQQLHLQHPSKVVSKEILEAADVLVNMKQNVSLDLSENQYTGIEDEDNLYNYEGGLDNVASSDTSNTFTFDISYVKHSCTVGNRKTTNNV